MAQQEGAAQQGGHVLIAVAGRRWTESGEDVGEAHRMRANPVQHAMGAPAGADDHVVRPHARRRRTLQPQFEPAALHQVERQHAHLAAHAEHAAQIRLVRDVDRPGRRVALV